MTVPARTHGKPGRRSPKRAPALRLGPLLTGVVPAHPAAEDYLAALGGGWQMLDNDQYGTCVPVTWANIRRLVTSTLTPKGYYPGLAEVIALYKTQNPGFPAEDNGCDIQTMLEYLAKTGGPDGVKAVAFASVDHRNAAEVKAAIAIFGCVWTGVNVLDVNMTQFDAGRPWDYDPSSPVDGGHSVITGGYGPAGTGALGGDERFITWAAETSFTDRFWSHLTEECWVVLWPEHLGSKAFLDGIDQVQLAADYQAITGKPLPLPPAPPVPPKPDPATVLEQLAGAVRDVAASAQKDITELLAFLAKNGL